MSRGLIGKFFSGVEKVSTPAALAAQAAGIEKQRMKILQGYNQENMAAQQANEVANIDTRQGYAVDNINQQQGFAIENRGQDQEFALENQDRQNTFTGGENDKRNALTREGLGMEGEKLNMAREQAKVVLESAQLGLVDQKRLSAMYEQISDPETDSETRDSIAEQILQLTGKATGDKFSALYQDEVDETGYPTGGRSTYILNTGTGGVSGIPDQSGNDGSSGKYASREAIREAYQSGIITREQAEQELLQFR